MSQLLKKLFERQVDQRRSCRIIEKRSAGAYIVRDELGRTFLATGDPGYLRSQQVVVTGKVIVGTGLEGRAVTTVEV